MIKTILIAAIILLTSQYAFTQHNGHDHNHNTTDSIKTDTTNDHKGHESHKMMDTTGIEDTFMDSTHTHPVEDHSGHNMHSMDNVPMSHIYSLNLPMSRNASGTAW